MRCPGCNFDNPDGAKVCNHCGEAMVRNCPSCGQEVRSNAKFCDECGCPLSPPSPDTAPEAVRAPIHYTPHHLAERIIAEQEALKARNGFSGERKVITALFADMSDSTALIQDLDPEEVRHLIDPVLDLMMEAVHHYEGYVAKSLGDGILALFGAPIAHEDHPQRALYAALRMQESMRGYADRVRREQGVQLQIRVGVHTGEVLMRSIRTEDLRVDYEPVGQCIHLASRMEGLATPGSIVVSEATHRLAEGYFEFKSLGTIPVKGVAEPLDVYEVLGSGPLRTRLQVAARRGLAPFVGRRNELERLSNALEQVRNAQGQVVGVVGEPGVGKSRLFYEFRPRAQQDCLVLETFSVSHGKAFAYLPLIELLKDYLQISPQDDERLRREKVTGKLLTLDRELEDCLPYLFYLLGMADPKAPLAQMDSRVRRRRTFSAIRRLLQRESLNQPVVVVFEDLQWLDSETGAFLEYLIEGIASVRLLLLVNFRPEYRHEWGNHSYYTQLQLDPLGQVEAEELLTTLLGVDPTLTAIKPRIMAQTEGNPFFLEEVVQTLVEARGLVGEPGHYRLAQTPETLQIPTTVQGVLAARIDRLAADEKALLQTLAVIGKEFPLSLVLRVVDQPEQEIRRLLSRLQAGEFLYERAAFPEVEFTFKHALTQEVSYGSLLSERRSALHERTARAIEVIFSGHLEERCSELAHHYSCSGNIMKAAEYLKRAGEQAIYRSANAEAAEHFAATLQLLNRLPEAPERARQELEVLLNQGAVLMALKGYGSRETGDTYNQALRLCRQVGTQLELFNTLHGLFAFHVVRGELESAREQSERLLELAEDTQDPEFLVEAHVAAGVVLFASGELTQSQAHMELASRHYDPVQHRHLAFQYGQDPGMVSLSFLSLILALTDEYSGALRRRDKALELARELSHSTSLAYALDLTADLHHYLDEAPEAQVYADSAISLATEQGLVFWLAYARVLHGWALTRQEQSETGIEEMRQGLNAYRATGAVLFLSHFLGLLADALIRANDTNEAMAALTEALSLVDKTGEHFCEAELYRLKGELLIGQAASQQIGTNVHEQAETCLQQAVEIAGRQGAKLLMRRAMLSLAQMRIQQGKMEDAHRLLSEVCNVETGVKESESLKSAKILLDRINSKI